MGISARNFLGVLSVLCSDTQSVFSANKLSIWFLDGPTMVKLVSGIFWLLWLFIGVGGSAVTILTLVPYLGVI